MVGQRYFDPSDRLVTQKARCLEREPEARLADAATARLELDDALAGRNQDSDAYPDPPAPSPRWKAALPWAVAGAAVVAMAATLIAARPTAVAPSCR